MFTSKFDRGFVRLGARVAEEDAVESREPREFVRKRPGRLVVEEVARLHERAGLFRDRRGDRRMRVPERADRDAGDHVEISVPIGVDQLAAFAAHDLDRRTIVILQQMSLARELFANLFGWRDDGRRRTKHRATSGNGR